MKPGNNFPAGLFYALNFFLTNKKPGTSPGFLNSFW